LGQAYFFGLASVSFEVFGYTINPYNSPGFASLCLYVACLVLLPFFHNPISSSPEKRANGVHESEQKLSKGTLFALLLLCLDMFVVFSVYAGIESVIVPLAEDYFHWGQKANGIMFVGLGAIALLDFLLMRYVLVKVPDRVLLVACLVCLCGGTVILNDFHTTRLPLVRFIIGQILLAAATAPGMTVIQSIQSKIWSEGNWGSVLVSLIAIGRVVGPLWVTASLLQMPDGKSDFISCLGFSGITALSLVLSLAALKYLADPNERNVEDGIN